MSATTILQFCSNFYVLEMEVTALNWKTVLLLTILIISVDIDVSDVLLCFSDVLEVLDVFIFFLHVVNFCLCSLSARFFIINNNNNIILIHITCVFLDFWSFCAHCLHCVLSASFAVIVLCPVLLFLVYRAYDSHNK